MDLLFSPVTLHFLSKVPWNSHVGGGHHFTGAGMQPMMTEKELQQVAGPQPSLDHGSLSPFLPCGLEESEMPSGSGSGMLAILFLPFLMGPT